MLPVLSIIIVLFACHILVQADDSNCSETLSYKAKYAALDIASEFIEKYRLLADLDWYNDPSGTLAQKRSDYLINRFNYKTDALLMELKKDFAFVRIATPLGQCISLETAVQVIKYRMKLFIEEAQILATESLISYVDMRDEKDRKHGELGRIGLWLNTDQYIMQYIKRVYENVQSLTIHTHFDCEIPKNGWTVTKEQMWRDYEIEWDAKTYESDDNGKDEIQRGDEVSTEAGSSILDTTSSDAKLAIAKETNIEDKPTDVSNSPAKPKNVSGSNCKKYVLDAAVKLLQRAQNSYIMGLDVDDKTKRENELKLHTETASTCLPNISNALKMLIMLLRKTYDTDSRNEINRDLHAAQHPEKFNDPATYQQIIGTIEFAYKIAARHLMLQFAPAKNLDDTFKQQIGTHLTGAKKELKEAFGHTKELIEEHQQSKQPIEEPEWNKVMTKERKANTIYLKWHQVLSKTYSEHKVFLRLLLPDAAKLSHSQNFYNIWEAAENFMKQFAEIKPAINRGTLYSKWIDEMVWTAWYFQFMNKFYKRLNKYGHEVTNNSHGVIHVEKLDGAKVESLVLNGILEDHDGHSSPYRKDHAGISQYFRKTKRN